eukprot:CAMPEP_0116921616 /NCGR_PEP_ID=MMETSP0467-20121206/21752_1 /TAXON_ID=283647 /ORGANISM="Mesodinium pulex, Strain SPMC105" /LENGTH=57 /DNA_ID=CAMNT_0004599749 /DNA_START=1145 /DNA_END=1318 /DNA_ORIENTATION=+
MLIIDNLAENFQVNPENGIFITTWFNDPEDTCLKELIPFLSQIVEDQSQDIREDVKM